MAAFFVGRDDHGPADDDPRWLGGSLEAKLDGGSRLWAIGAARSGHRGLRQLGGWAMDAGATWVLPDLSGAPSITVGYARGSGDTVSGDDRDTTFRQTDLEDNSARFGGLRRLTYYGELFDPELSNLQVLTAGAGLRPTRSVGVDLVLHRYVQTVLRDSIPSSAFDLDATGVHGMLGHEVDAAVTIRAGRFDIDLAAGAFLAGPGLARERRLAFFWRPQVRLYF
jgi:alginate production protein